MDFMYITSLGTSYKYDVKIEQKFKKKRKEFGSAKYSQLKYGNGGPNPFSKG